MGIYVGLTLLLIVPGLVKSDGPIVDTRLGSIRGFWKVSRGGRQYEAFEGIPYALPPVGQLRFEPPQPATAWDGQISATNSSSPCVQYLGGTKYNKPGATGVEDCLYLNVYTPERRNITKLLPVIIYLHGGGFQTGSANECPPDYFMDDNVVYAAPNYRVGILGFLSTEDRVVPGNMGLKDQSLAIKWISENIDSFGGDPNSVTIGGHSSGGVSVHYHYLSPMSRGLFHRGISGSGTSLNCWSQMEAAAEKARKLGALMSCPTDNTAKMIECLKTRPAKEIAQFESEFLVWLYNPSAPFGPVTEKDSPNPFIDKSPMEIISRGEIADLPWIAGATHDEGIYIVAKFIDWPERVRYADENWNYLAPFILDYNYTIPITNHVTVARKIRNFYMSNSTIDIENADYVVRMIGDRLLGSDAGKTVREQARVNRSPVWFYSYDHRGEYSVSQAFSRTDRSFGVAHADDHFLILSDPAHPLHRNDDVRMSFVLVKFWVSFATTGIPEVGTDWLRVNGSSDELNILRISSPDDIRMDSDDDYAETKFWNSIDFDENVLPSDDK